MLCSNRVGRLIFTARNFRISAFKLTDGRKSLETFTYQAQMNCGHPILNEALTDSETADYWNPDRNLLWCRVIATETT